ncbi:hypothetical protein P5G51_000900 [Virgibacillus sp. 179-BFC.A HS]|uniref:Membrane protein YkvI n=1 Tax=Tigheibacillus jepli TaxID=3035914 RepID=A0ABU5CF60_9BACI|nr:hypothetical protein [Virgibacillus sp. 179-BFC.A HS]MDY0404155.1 hypothetical protein [Virgibacillus sp. 179-BFC.A HS]
MLRILKIGSAFIGVIVGAGFASGQEILQYFTSFGYLGILGALVSTILFAYLGFILLKLGSRTRTTSHKEVIYQICGPYLGRVVDYIIIFTLFGVGVVMLAGAGSILQQQFGVTPFIGSLLMAILVIATVMLNVDKVVAVIGSVTPFLIVAIVVIGIYSIFTMDMSFAALEPIAASQKSTLPNWFIAGVNYASFNIALGAAMALVMGGAEKNERTAATGGFLGGLGLGVLILISNLAIFSKIDVVAAYDMPMLKIVDEISPILAVAMSIILFGMIFNTAVGMFYAFAARLIDMKKSVKKTGMFITVTVGVGFAASFFGFTKLVAFFYPLIGYLGLLLIAALIVAPFRFFRKPKADKTKAMDNGKFV